MKRKPTRPEGMSIAEFIETYLSSRKVQPFQKQIIEKMANGEKLAIMRPDNKSVIAQLRDERVVVNPLKQKKQKPVVVLDEAVELPDDFFDDRKDSMALLYSVQKTDVGDNPFYADWVEAKRKKWGEQSPAWEAYKNGDWGIDLAQGKDKSVIIKSLPKDDAGHDGSTDKN